MVDISKVRICLLPGGKMPVRMSAGAVGFDVCLRALVSVHDKDPNIPDLRKTVFDFRTMPEDKHVEANVVVHGDVFKYRLEPGQAVLGGIGFVTEMPVEMFYWVAPRSGLASKWGITVSNAPGTVDSDYRGEAGAIIFNHSDKPCLLAHGMRIAQIIFQTALIPTFEEVQHLSELAPSGRGSDGFGSTGLT